MSPDRRPANAVPRPRFTVDHMLVKLGKYLRILGFDADWHPGLRTHELIHRANAEDRWFLTRNTRIEAQYPLPRRWLQLQSSDPVAQLDEVVKAAGLDPAPLLFTTCIRCNVALESVEDKAQIQGRVHPNVYRSFDRFYRCPSCDTVFWKGSHVRNTCRKLAPVLGRDGAG